MYPRLLLTKYCCMCKTCTLVLERKELMKKGKFQDIAIGSGYLFSNIFADADKFNKRTKLNFPPKMVYWLC